MAPNLFMIHLAYMKRFELLIAVLLLPVDFFMLFFAATSAYFLRFNSAVTQYRPVQFDIDLSVYLQTAFPLIILWMIFYALSGMYSITRPRRILTEIKKIVVASSLGFAAITILIFLRGELFDSRFIVLAAFVFAIVYIILARFVMRAIRFACYKRGVGVKRVILVGSEETANQLAEYFAKHPKDGFQVIARIKNVNKDSLAQLKKKIKQLDAEMLLIASESVSRKDSEHLLDIANNAHIQFAYTADLFETKASNTEVTTVGDFPVIEIKQTPLDGWGRIAKRLFDFFAGMILFLLSLPVMIIIAILIKLEDGGPVLYKNQRVGKEESLFFVYKFRRFKPEFNTGPGYDNDGKAAKLEEELIKKQSVRQGPIYKVLDDPRMTKVGSFLEKTSLDELPQFFNVILGNMSLVGPRPHQPREVKGYSKKHRRVFAIKPGITGIAQISGRSDLDYEDEVRLDTFYIENWTMRKDIAILLKTPFSLLKKHKA